MQFSDSEWKVMNAVWKGYPVTARQVLERLGAESTWAYTTVKTFLERLVEKEAVKSEKQGNTSIYTPLVTQGQARQQAVRAFVTRTFDGAFGPLVSCLLSESDLSERDREALREIIERQDAKDATEEEGDES